jgi:hypothetical protein
MVFKHNNLFLPPWHGIFSTCAAIIYGRSGGSFVVTPDCEAAVLGSNPAISPAYRGLPVLRWAAIWDGTLLKAVL